MNAICLECQSRVCAHVSRPSTRRLTAREVELLRLLSRGVSNKELSAATGLTVGTVKVYLHRVFEKIGVKKRFQAALWARDHAGLFSDAPATLEEAKAS